ncbi:conserved unknown protein [Ectocarpus siliculosus]|uniref:RCC1-like domain-containing protein n=1 Tax=Ectocarpus siliculosus TaxID=2880 RepID=D7FS37_ECTSI|nr:conserved unknown protein [Ectocarpus siliculosus]|eukprot:CBJ30978.1 conserved unknown protein [Ectocarpus siliculosus]
MARGTAFLALASGLMLERSMAVMDVGDEHVCATIGSSAKCWGNNRWGQLGRGDNTTLIGDEPDEMGDNLVAVPVGGTVAEVALGEDHTCMLLDSGNVVCFGKNDSGQLGLGDTSTRGQIAGDVGEAADLGAGLSAVAVALGCRHTCGLLDDGTVKCFGYNNYGQLGQGTTENMGDDAGEMGDDLPAVSLDGTVSAVAAGCDHTCALMDDGTVMCWGRNTHGQLGTGDSDDRLDGNGLALVAVDLDGSVATAIAAGESHTCALLDDDSIKCWGLNSSGQLGQGDDLDRGDSPETLGANLPAIALGTGDVPTAIDCGSFYTCALLDDGSAKCFGANADGELGTGTTQDVGLLPTEMGDNLIAAAIGDTAQDIAAGGATTCAIVSDDSVICWGQGSSGQLGQGTDENIIVIEDVETIDVGSDTFASSPGPTPSIPIDITSSPTVVTTRPPLGPGETHSPTVAPSSVSDLEATSGASVHFHGGLLATAVVGAAGFIAGALFL